MMINGAQRRDLRRRFKQNSIEHQMAANDPSRAQVSIKGGDRNPDLEKNKYVGKNNTVQKKSCLK